MKSTKFVHLLLAIAAVIMIAVPVKAQDPNKTDPEKTTDRTTQDPKTNIESGKKQKIRGVIVRREPDSFILRDDSGADITVNLNSGTQVSERKSNPFRGAKNYGVTSLLRGLAVEVEGRGTDAGALVADKIRFTNDEYKVARSIESRVTPVETGLSQTTTRVEQAEGRLTQGEQNAQRLAGQLEELAALANTANSGAKAAQETADTALGAAKNAQAAANSVNERVSTLDDYEARQNVTVTFKLNSAMLSEEAKTTLDELANQAKEQKGYVIQITGYASADGNEMRNRRLSERRADAVIRYLATQHDVPLRRMITPFGFGEDKPVADNTTREGREQNRRVEVAILVSKGLAAPSGTTTENPTNNADAGPATTDSQRQRASSASTRP